MKIIRHKSILLSCAISLMYTSGIVAAFISLLTLALCGHHLTPLIVFTLLSIINVLRNSALRSIGEGTQFVYEAYVSFHRIQEFLMLPNLRSMTDVKPLTNVRDDSLQSTDHFEKEKVDIITKEFSCFNESLKKSDDIRKFVDILDNQNQNPLTEMTNLGLSQPENLRIKEEQIREKAERRMVTLSNVTCKIDSNKCPVKSIYLEANEEHFAIITGPVGSGKSTLLSVITGEIPVTEGNIQCCGGIAYVPQIPWVFSGTLRENILFGRPFDFEKYIRTIKACALDDDIEGFPDKDQVIIGERGDTLSGGQKTRISLARAVYADCDIYLLDNPLAALDVNVSNDIFNHCVLGLLSGKVRLMVSHQESHMKLADEVIVLHNGSVIDQGTFSELSEKEALRDTVEPQNKSIQETFFEELITTNTIVHCSSKKLQVKGIEIPDEDRMTGTVSCKLYWDYLTAGVHPITLGGLALMFLLCQGKERYKPVMQFGKIMLWAHNRNVFKIR